MPRSAREVARALEAGPLTWQEVRSRTGLPDRTIRFAVARLREARIVTVRRSLRDARQKILFLAQTSEDRGPRRSPS